MFKSEVMSYCKCILKAFLYSIEHKFESIFLRSINTITIQ